MPTANLSLAQPAGGDRALISDINDNSDKLDAAFSPTGVGALGAVVAHLRDVTVSPSYTGTTSKASVDIQPTWNTTGAMYCVRYVVTHTAAGAASRAIEIRRGSNTIFDVDITTNVAVNGVSFIGGATGQNLQMAAIGADANIGVSIVPKGSGQVTITNLGGVTNFSVTSGGAAITGNSTITGDLTVTGTLTAGIPSTLSTYLDMNEIAAPASPVGSVIRIYAKSDGQVYKKDSAGVESSVGGGGDETVIYGFGRAF